MAYVSQPLAARQPVGPSACKVSGGYTGSGQCREQGFVQSGQWQRAAQCQFKIGRVVSGQAMARGKRIEIGHGDWRTVYPQAQRRGSGDELPALGCIDAFAPLRAQKQVADFKQPQGGNPDIAGSGGV